MGNGGLENNISYDFLKELFGKYGKIVEIIMQKKRSYAFIIYEDKESANSSVRQLQATEITKNQTPIFFYLISVDKGFYFIFFYIYCNIYFLYLKDFFNLKFQALKVNIKN